MFRKNLDNFAILPVQQKIRKRTDVLCTVIGAIFALTMFILSFIMFRKDNQGKTCSRDLPHFPYIYFTNPNNLLQDRFCVSQCPNKNQELLCSQNNVMKCELAGPSSYSTHGVINRLGAFCNPIDQKLNQHIWNQPQLAAKQSILNSIDVILYSLFFGLFIGLLYMVFVACFPKVMIYAVFVLNFIVLLVAGIYIFVKPIRIFSPNVWNILIGIALILMGIVYLIFLITKSNQIKLAAIFLQHGNQALNDACCVFLYILLFVIFTLGFIVLIVWQYIAFGTSNQTYLQENSIFRQSSHNFILQALNIIQFIWGIQFLRDAFNFIISGNSVQWYFKSQNNFYKQHYCQSFTRLLCLNWGSVVGGSFLNAFLIIFDSITDLFRCNKNGSCGKCSNIYNNCCCCSYIFELVRTDAYAYINLTGIPYCNSARQCQALCQNNQGFIGSQSCTRLYRHAAHILLVTLTVIFGYCILHSRGSNYTNWYILVLIILASYCISCYFVDIHANAADGVMVCYLTQKATEGSQGIKVCPNSLKSDLYVYNKYLDLEQKPVQGDF